jgi:hypothetical protein
MTIKEKIQNVLAKLQALPDTKKKIILFSIVGVCAIIIGYFEVQATRRDIEKIRTAVKSTNVPPIDFSTDPNRAPTLNLENIDLSSLTGTATPGDEREPLR